MQGHHPGTKSTCEYLVELGHDSEALRKLMNANFQSLKQALVSRESEYNYIYSRINCCLLFCWGGLFIISIPIDTGLTMLNRQRGILFGIHKR
jgi:hypothetical protein